jgi:hypothetical protein
MPSLHDIVTKGSTSRSVVLHIMDSTDGTPETGVVYNTSGIDLWYRREGAARVAITEATLAALTTAWASGGFLHVSDGDYRLDLPDAAFATGANYVDFGGTVTGMIVVGGRVRLVDFSLEVNWSTSAAAGASGGLLISGSNAGTTTLGALTITGATTHTGATVHTGAVTMAAGLAITQSASNTAGLSVTGNGTGHGIVATSGSGATGDGIRAVAASTNGNAVSAAGVGTGAGVLATGGATGHGISGVGGSTSGNGIKATGTAGNSAAMNLVGQGSNAGLLSTGGATGHGMSLAGGSTSGNAIHVSDVSPSGAEPEFGIVAQGQLQSATTTGAVLASAEAFGNDTLIGCTAWIYGPTQGYWQETLITASALSGDTITYETLAVAPTGTPLKYKIFGTAAGAGGSGLDAAGVRTAIGLSTANLDTQLSGLDGKLDTIDNFVDTEVAAIKTKTDFLPSATAGSAGGLFIAGSNAATSITTALTANVIGNLTGNVSGSVGSATVVNGLAANVITAAATATDFTTEIQTGLATAASLATVAGYIDTEVAAILAAVDTEVGAIKAKTDNLPASPAATGDIPAASAIADAVWDEVQSGHATNGTFGKYLDSAISGVSTGGVSAGEIAEAVWDEPLSGHQDAGSAGAALSDASEGGGGGGGDATEAKQDILIAALAVVDGNVISILQDTAEIGTAGAGLTAIATQESVTAIKAKTDQFTFTTTNKVDSRVDNVAGTPLTPGGTGNQGIGGA